MASDPFSALGKALGGGMGAGVAIGLGAAVAAPIVVPAVASLARPALKTAIKAGIVAYDRSRSAGTRAWRFGRREIEEIGEAAEHLYLEAAAEVHPESGGSADEATSAARDRGNGAGTVQAEAHDPRPIVRPALRGVLSAGVRVYDGARRVGAPLYERTRGQLAPLGAAARDLMREAAESARRRPAEAPSEQAQATPGAALEATPG